MALKQTQPRSGHLRGVSTNKTDRTGRSNGTDGGQKGTGYPHKKDGPVSRGTRGVPDQGKVRGYTGKVTSRGLSPVRKDLVDRDPKISR